MAVSMKTLVGDEIPAVLCREGLDMVFTVESSDGAIHYFESDIEALQLLIELDEEERRARQ